MDEYDVQHNAQFESAIDRVDITNDFMFSFIMRKEDICIELLEYLLPDRKIEHIEYLSVEEGGQLGSKVRPETQKTMLECVSKRMDVQFRANQAAVQGDFPQACRGKSREINAEVQPEAPKMRVQDFRNTL